MNTGWHEKMVTAVSVIILSFTVVHLLIPGTGAVAADSGRQADVLPAPTGLNMTNVSSENHTVPVQQPELVLTNGQIELRETLLPALKGDMAVGPRRIDLVFLAGLVLVVGAVTAGVWYIQKRMPDEDAEGTSEEDMNGRPDEDTEEKPDGDTKE